MKIVDGELIPGVALGEFYIGMEKKEVLKKLKGDYTEKNVHGDIRIILENAEMWFSRRERLTQIGVTEGFKGVYKNVIGIGTTLEKVQAAFGGYKEKPYAVYFAAGLEGLCFELADNDIDEEWVELEAPIEWIFIYDVNYNVEDDCYTVKYNVEEYHWQDRLMEAIWKLFKIVRRR